MKSACTGEFWDLDNNLPPGGREEEHEAYSRWMENPKHPGLNFEKLQAQDDTWSARITQGHRAVCSQDDDGCYVWWWIGTKGEFKSKFGGK